MAIKPYRPPYAPQSATKPLALSNRGAVLAILSIPLLLAALAFILTIIAASLSVEHGIFAKIVVFSYLYLMVGLIYLPAYGVSYVWYWFRAGDDANLGRSLLRIPLISTAFVWFPTLSPPQLANPAHAKSFLILAGINLIVCYLWVAVVRLILRTWRKI